MAWDASYVENKFVKLKIHEKEKKLVPVAFEPVDNVDIMDTVLQL